MKFAIQFFSYSRIAVIFITVLFIVGGSSRADVQSLVILRPFAVLFLILALSTLKWHRVQRNWPLLALAGVTVGWCLVQVIPLPPAVWHGLPGRDLVAEIDRLAGIEGQWRPIAISPTGARNAVWSLAAPLAMLVSGVQMEAASLRALAWPVLAISGASAIFGVLQLGADPNGQLYPYAITNNGSLVGLFANRNHQAVLLAATIPLAAVCIGSARKLPKGAKAPLLGFMTGMIMLLLLVCGSRSGFLLGMLACLATPLLLVRTHDMGRHSLAAPLAVAIVGAFALLASAFGRTAAIDRLNVASIESELRLETLPVVTRMAEQAWPFGLGQGSFERAFMIHEPDRLLSPRYLNHAHNDWIEAVITGGLPVACLLIATLVGVSILGFRVLKAPLEVETGVMHGRLGLILLILFGLASLVDYPLRVPSLACLAVIAGLWLFHGATSATYQLTGSGESP